MLLLFLLLWAKEQHKKSDGVIAGEVRGNRHLTWDSWKLTSKLKEMGFWVYVSNLTKNKNIFQGWNRLRTFKNQQRYQFLRQDLQNNGFTKIPIFEVILTKYLSFCIQLRIVSNSKWPSQDNRKSRDSEASLIIKTKFTLLRLSSTGQTDHTSLMHDPSLNFRRFLLFSSEILGSRRHCCEILLFSPFLRPYLLMKLTIPLL